LAPITANGNDSTIRTGQYCHFQRSEKCVISSKADPSGCAHKEAPLADAFAMKLED
jgi:hypothetical protein